MSVSRFFILSSLFTGPEYVCVNFNFTMPLIIEFSNVPYSSNNFFFSKISNFANKFDFHKDTIIIYKKNCIYEVPLES